jgi:hypothetical protein
MPKSWYSTIGTVAALLVSDEISEDKALDVPAVVRPAMAELLDARLEYEEVWMG